MANPSSIFSIIGQAATVALIVIATRWLSRAKGTELPKIRGDTSVYGMKWQWRVVGLAAGLGYSALVLLPPYNLNKVAGWVSLIAMLVLGLLGLWMAIGGSVTTDPGGITMKGLWRTTSVRWHDVTEIRLHKRDGGAIELRAGPQKLIVDVRFVARQHLLDEIIANTRLQPHGNLT